MRLAPGPQVRDVLCRPVLPSTARSLHGGACDALLRQLPSACPAGRGAWHGIAILALCGSGGEVIMRDVASPAISAGVDHDLSAVCGGVVSLEPDAADGPFVVAGGVLGAWVPDDRFELGGGGSAALVAARGFLFDRVDLPGPPRSG